MPLRAVHVLLLLAGAPNYDAFSDRDGNITTERQGRALFQLLQDSGQVEALFADAEAGNPRAKKIVRELESSYFPDTGRELADLVSRPPCLLPAVRELSGWCVPNWAFIDFLKADKPGGARLRKALFQGFEERARERHLENQLILSAMNAVVGVSVAASAIRSAEVAGASQSSVAVREEAGSIDPNKLHHLFDKPRHLLDDLVRACGGQEAAFLKIQEAANAALREGRLVMGPDGILARKTGVNVIEVEGFQVQLIGGRVVNGKVEIGTISREGLR